MSNNEYIEIEKLKSHRRKEKLKRLAKTVGKASSKVLKKTGQVTGKALEKTGEFTRKKVEEFRESRKPEAQLAKLEAQEKRLKIQKSIATKRKSISKMKSTSGLASFFAPPKQGKGQQGGFGTGTMPGLGGGFGMSAPRRPRKSRKGGKKAVRRQRMPMLRL